MNAICYPRNLVTLIWVHFGEGGQQLWQCNALASQAHRLFRKSTQNASCMAEDPNLGRWLCDQRQRLRSMGVRASRYGTGAVGWC